MASGKPWKLAALAAAGLLVAAGCGGGGPRRATPSTAAPPRPVTLKTSGPYAWSEVSSPALAIGGGPTAQLSAVAAPAGATGDLWLIAGTVVGLDGKPQATIWSSRDGLTWTAQPLDAGGPSEATGVTYWANRAVVVGAVGAGSGRRAAVWVSGAPGARFTPVARAAAFSDPAGAAMTVVAAGTLGLFAAGHAGTQQVVWYSSDGTHWTREDNAARLLASEPGAQIDALLVAPQGVFAAGSRRDGALEQAAMWASSDASTWRDVRAPQSFTGPSERRILGLATLAARGASAQGTELVAVGGIRSGASWSPASWVSPDGASWSQPVLAFPRTARPEVEEGGERVDAVATTGTTLIAVGGGSTQQVWSSTDGRSWAEVPLPSTATNAAGWRTALVASAGGTTVIADGVYGQPQVLAKTPGGWSEPSANPAVFGPHPSVAYPAALLQAGGRLLLAVDVETPGPTLGQETSTVDFLSSADGRTWEALAGSPEFSGTQVTALAAGLQPDGAVAVGGPDPKSSTQKAGSIGPTAWTSPDGDTWNVAPGGPAPLSGTSGPARLKAVTRLGDSYVAVGWTPTIAGAQAAMAWISAGGKTWQRGEPLDPPAAATTADVALGVCARAGQVVAVGAGDQPHVGQEARAWSLRNGLRWASATVTPPPAPGARERMEGCLALPRGAAGQDQPSWLAYGQSTDPAGGATPAVWTSDNGIQWTRTTLAPATGGSAGVQAVAMHGPSGLAVGGTGQTGLWSSKDHGRTWQRLDASAPPWPGPDEGTVSLTRVAFAGADPVVAGQVDGRLTVWIGTPPG